MTESPASEFSATPVDADLMRRRYGTGRPRSVLLLAAIALLGLLFVGWVVWAGVQQADQDVRWSTVGYSDVTDTSVTVDFDVFKPAGVQATCLVRALDKSSAEVGRAEVPITTQESDTHMVYTLRVTARPITAEVTECQLDPSN